MIVCPEPRRRSRPQHSSHSNGCIFIYATLRGSKTYLHLWTILCDQTVAQSWVLTGDGDDEGYFNSCNRVDTRDIGNQWIAMSVSMQCSNFWINLESQERELYRWSIEWITKSWIESSRPCFYHSHIQYRSTGHCSTVLNVYTYCTLESRLQFVRLLKLRPTDIKWVISTKCIVAALPKTFALTRKVTHCASVQRASEIIWRGASINRNVRIAAKDIRKTILRSGLPFYTAVLYLIRKYSNMVVYSATISYGQPSQNWGLSGAMRYEVQIGHRTA